jgi:hypothetical protein
MPENGMGEDSIPEDLREFLLKNFDSVAQWEGLLLLRAQPEKSWDAEDVARNLYITEPDAARLLADLEARAMITVADAQPPALYRYQPQRDLDALIRRAAELYKRSVIPIANLIHSKPKTRVRQFADAFRIRKKE